MSCAALYELEANPGSAAPGPQAQHLEKRENGVAVGNPCNDQVPRGSRSRRPCIACHGADQLWQAKARHGLI